MSNASKAMATILLDDHEWAELQRIRNSASTPTGAAIEANRYLRELMEGAKSHDQS
jgi:hypothetical protein